MIKLLLSNDFRYTLINQIWKLLSGPALLLFIPIYLSSSYQGYWYSFISLAALVILADLGFSNIVLQFSAHEYSRLKFDDDGLLTGDPKKITRMAALFRYSIRWSLKMSCFVFPIIFLIGYYVLDSDEVPIEWEWAWLLYSLASIGIFLNSIVFSFIEGCDKVGEVHKIRFKVSFVTIVSNIVMLIFSYNLYALAIPSILAVLVGAFLIISRFKTLIVQLLNTKVLNEIADWSKEIRPLLIRYSVSCVSGVIIFQAFTPLAFHSFGAIEAGKVGISMSIFSAVFGISSVWIIMILPKINILVATGKYEELNSMFLRHFGLSIITYIMGVAMIFISYNNLKGEVVLFDRLVGETSLVMISISWFLQLIVNSVAIYLRAHKREPLVSVSVFTAIYIFIMTLLLSKFESFDYFFVGFLSSYLFSLAWVAIIFSRESRAGFRVGY